MQIYIVLKMKVKMTSDIKEIEEQNYKILTQYVCGCYMVSLQNVPKIQCSNFGVKFAWK